MTSKPIVAVVGAGTWRPDDLPEDRWKIVGNAPATLSANSTPANYWAGIIQAVRLVAPDVRFISSTAAGADGELSKDSISESVADVLSAEPRPDILLATFGPFNDKTIEDLFAQAARQGVLVVIPAGNDRSAPIPFAGNPALPDLMIAAAVTPDGKRTAFTQTGDSVFWAPGEAVPITARPTTSKDGIAVVSGTSYSAAFAAGIAARLKDARPGLTPSGILSALRKAAKSAGDGPAILNLQSALAQLPNP